MKKLLKNLKELQRLTKKQTKAVEKATRPLDEYTNELLKKVQIL